MADGSGGIPPVMPRKPVIGSVVAGLRPLRHRMRQAREAIDRGRQGSQSDTARELVVVIDGGHMPSGTDRVYLTNPVAVDADDSEGATPTFTPDTSQTIPVVFVGSPPIAGDYATAHAIAGRWVAEHGGAKPCGCTACDGRVPLADLTVDYEADENGTPEFNGPHDLPLRGSGGIWNTDDLGGIIISLGCGSPTPSLLVNFTNSGDTFFATLVSYTASPFKAVYKIDAGINMDGTYTVTGPSSLGTNPKYCVRICVNGPCGGLPGASVAISDQDGNPIASGTTGFGRCVQLDVGSAGTYTVTVDLPGKGGYKAVTYTQTLNIQGCQVGLLCCAATCFDFCGDVTGCPPSVRIVGEGHGAIYDGPLAVNRTPSGSLGCVSVPIQDPGDTYTAFLSDLPPGYAADPGGYPVHCGNNTYQPLLTVTPDSFGVRHCCGVPIPAVLTLTDAKGGCTLTYDPTTGNWTGCHTFEQANTYICGSNPNTCGTRQISIVYTCNCQADGGTGQRLFSVTRQWFQLVAIPVGCADPSYHESGCGGVCPDGGASGGPCICTSGALLPIAPCEAFSVAGPLVVDPINSCNSTSGFVNSVDPVGGGVAIS